MRLAAAKVFSDLCREAHFRRLFWVSACSCVVCVRSRRWRGFCRSPGPAPPGRWGRWKSHLRPAPSSSKPFLLLRRAGGAPGGVVMWPFGSAGRVIPAAVAGADSDPGPFLFVLGTAVDDALPHPVLGGNAAGIASTPFRWSSARRVAPTRNPPQRPNRAAPCFSPHPFSRGGGATRPPAFVWAPGFRTHPWLTGSTQRT